jgi:hypothetical protein
MADLLKQLRFTDADGNTTITINGKNGNYEAGAEGHDGDIMLKDQNGKLTIHLNGADGGLYLGGPGQDGDIKLKNAKNQQTIHINGRSAAIHLGGNGEDGDIFIKNEKGSEVILLDGKTGNIRVSGKVVETADFVFDENYALPTLEAVKSHIRIHKHLPDVPSAAEITAKGLELNSFSMSLLRKVEELTLYVIEQNETIQHLQTRLNTLENQA